jgi:hypothetical protein
MAAGRARRLAACALHQTTRPLTRHTAGSDCPVRWLRCHLHQHLQPTRRARVHAHTPRTHTHTHKHKKKHTHTHAHTHTHTQAKKRRGGRRLRKMKERYGLTDVSVCCAGAAVAMVLCGLLCCPAPGCMTQPCAASTLHDACARHTCSPRHTLSHFCHTNVTVPHTLLQTYNTDAQGGQPHEL